MRTKPNRPTEEKGYLLSKLMEMTNGKGPDCCIDDWMKIQKLIIRLKKKDGCIKVVLTP
ncbi:hypothetical protein [Autumnicola psychrophila]|uniref:Uncharacterized protein n=1 Tax=Autumnicola psychrophila TaxID=3075592 RepID=A0ABU3DVA7_9FLAO|nr:hypothetical protein [Zunongwangia sp. F225]MDT0687646.1 hypothetical protein [Zunongwangia sp. F225]